MARSRIIKPGFFNNDILAEIPPLGRLLFAGLWTIADRGGRLEDRPKRIKATLLPYDECDVDKLLAHLHDRGFIHRYGKGLNAFIQVSNWDKHQQPHIKEAESTIPAPDEYHAGTVQEPDEPTTSMEEESLVTSSISLTSSISKEVSARAPKPIREKETDNFTLFAEGLWEIYPRDKDGIRPGRKAKFMEALKKVSVSEWDDVEAGLEKYKQMDQVKRGFVQNAETWVKEVKWKECLDAQPINQSNGTKASINDPEVRAKLLPGGKYSFLFDKGEKT